MEFTEVETNTSIAFRKAVIFSALIAQISKKIYVVISGTSSFGIAVKGAPVKK